MQTKTPKHSAASDKAKKGFSAWLVAKKWHMVLFVASLVFICVYVSGVILFFNIFMPNTKLSGRDISLNSIEQVADNLDVRSDNYCLRAENQDFSCDIAADQISLKLDGVACAQKTIAKTLPWAWPVTIFVPHNLELSKQATFDTDAAQNLVFLAVDKFNKTATAPTPAKVQYNTSSRAFEMQPGVVGTELDKDRVSDAVLDALTDFQTELALPKTCLSGYEADANTNNLAKACLDANAKLSLTAQLSANDQVIQTFGPDDMHNWIAINDDGSASFDLTLMKTWVEDNLSKKLNTVGSKRTYTRPDGKVVTVKGGTYGWKANTNAIAEALFDKLSQGQNALVSISYTQKAAQFPDEHGVDFQNTYIDVDLSQQHARFYQNGNVIWESDIISGNPTNGHATPQGVFFINNNFNKTHTQATLRGNIDPETGQPEYESQVSYWMPFSGNSIGLHDASWQSGFGGKAYLSRGSHGCINLPTNKAKGLVSLVDRGLVVIVHA